TSEWPGPFPRDARTASGCSSVTRGHVVPALRPCTNPQYGPGPRQGMAPVSPKVSMLRSDPLLMVQSFSTSSTRSTRMVPSGAPRGGKATKFDLERRHAKHRLAHGGAVVIAPGQLAAVVLADREQRQDRHMHVGQRMPILVRLDLAQLVEQALEAGCERCMRA